jgi:hypothetical protein
MAVFQLQMAIQAVINLVKETLQRFVEAITV